MRFARMPVTVVTGEFGSGKSTLVDRLLTLGRTRGEKVAVVSASLDPPSSTGAQLVLTADEEILERSPGCPCCAVRHDLVRLLGNLGGRRNRPDRVIVETSAVADVATIEQTLLGDSHLRRVVTLDGVLTTVDAYSWSARLKLRRLPGRVVEEQIALADIVVVNRAERLNEDGFETVMRGLRVRNRFASLCLALPGGGISSTLLDAGRSDPARLADRLDRLPLGRIGCSAGGLHTLVLSVAGNLDRTRVDDCVHELMHRYGKGLLRFHAVLTLAPGEEPGGPVVLRGLRNHLVHETDPRTRRSSPDDAAGPVNRLAVMGRELDLDELQHTLAGCVVA